MLLTMLITGHIWSQVGGNIVSRAADIMHLFRWLFYLLHQAVCVWSAILKYFKQNFTSWVIRFPAFKTNCFGKYSKVKNLLDNTKVSLITIEALLWLFFNSSLRFFLFVMWLGLWSIFSIMFLAIHVSEGVLKLFYAMNIRKQWIRKWICYYISTLSRW